MTIREHLYQIVIAIDQLVNTLFGGYADETISARCYRKRHKRYWAVLRFLLDLIFYPIDGKGHCMQAFNNEQQRVHMPSVYRG